MNMHTVCVCSDELVFYRAAFVGCVGRAVEFEAAKAAVIVFEAEGLSE